MHKTNLLPFKQPAVNDDSEYAKICRELEGLPTMLTPKQLMVGKIIASSGLAGTTLRQISDSTGIHVNGIKPIISSLRQTTQDRINIVTSDTREPRKRGVGTRKTKKLHMELGSGIETLSIDDNDHLRALVADDILGNNNRPDKLKFQNYLLGYLLQFKLGEVIPKAKLEQFTIAFFASQGRNITKSKSIRYVLEAIKRLNNFTGGNFIKRDREENGFKINTSHIKVSEDKRSFSVTSQANYSVSRSIDINSVLSAALDKYIRRQKPYGLPSAIDKTTYEELPRSINLFGEEITIPSLTSIRQMLDEHRQEKEKKATTNNNPNLLNKATVNPELQIVRDHETGKFIVTDELLRLAWATIRTRRNFKEQSHMEVGFNSFYTNWLAFFSQFQDGTPKKTRDIINEFLDKNPDYTFQGIRQNIDRIYKRLRTINPDLTIHTKKSGEKNHKKFRPLNTNPDEETGNHRQYYVLKNTRKCPRVAASTVLVVLMYEILRIHLMRQPKPEEVDIDDFNFSQISQGLEILGDEFKFEEAIREIEQSNSTRSKIKLLNTYDLQGPDPTCQNGFIISPKPTELTGSELSPFQEGEEVVLNEKRFTSHEKNGKHASMHDRKDTFTVTSLYETTAIIENDTIKIYIQDSRGKIYKVPLRWLLRAPQNLRIIKPVGTKAPGEIKLFQYSKEVATIMGHSLTLDTLSEEDFFDDEEEIDEEYDDILAEMYEEE